MLPLCQRSAAVRVHPAGIHMRVHSCVATPPYACGGVNDRYSTRYMSGLDTWRWY